MDNLVKVHTNNVKKCFFYKKETCPHNNICDCKYIYKNKENLTNFEKIADKIKNDLISSVNIEQFTDRLKMIQNGMSFALYMCENVDDKVDMQSMLEDIKNYVSFEIIL